MTACDAVQVMCYWLSHFTLASSTDAADVPFTRLLACSSCTFVMAAEAPPPHRAPVSFLNPIGAAVHARGILIAPAAARQQSVRHVKAEVGGLVQSISIPSPLLQAQAGSPSPQSESSARLRALASFRRTSSAAIITGVGASGSTRRSLSMSVGAGASVAYMQGRIGKCADSGLGHRDGLTFVAGPAANSLGLQLFPASSQLDALSSAGRSH